MTSIHPFRKHFCVLFISVAILTTFLSLRKRQSSHKSLINYIDDLADFQNTSFVLKNEFFKLNLSSVTDGLEGGRKVVHVLGLFEFTTKWGRRYEGESEMSAAKLAVDHVNALNVLPGYSLELLVNDTECDPGVGIDRFFHALYSKKTILTLIGAGCSNVSERLAHVVPYWNVIQVSYGSTSPSLSDRNKFPLFFRTVAPDSSHNGAKIHFVKAFGWKVVATFSQRENEYLLPVNHLVKELEKVNVSCISTVTFSLDNYKEQLKVLRDLDIRIIFGSFSNSITSKIFCAVYEMGMYGEYVWILQNRGQLWNHSNDCPISEMQRAAEGAVMISDFSSISEDEYSISGLRDEDFAKSLNISKTYVSKYAKQAYDAVWTIALALRESESYYWFDPIADYHYARKDMVCRWVERISSLRFIGLSGPVKFQGADRIGNSIIQQIQDGAVVDVAVFDSTKDMLDFKCKTCLTIKWKNNLLPIAQRMLKIYRIKIPIIIFYGVVFVSSFGIAASLLFLYFNLHFRRMKSVKLSSPKLNNVAVVGCILAYSSVILLGFHNTTIIRHEEYFSRLCSVRVYLLSAGFSLTFGSMLAKTYRVHRLFTYLGAGLVKDKLLKDKQLIGLILVPLITDALILALWVAIDPLERRLYNLTMESSSAHRGVVYQPQVEVCSSYNTVGWYVALFGYKTIILIMGVFMAWETRHVKIPALNDSQYIGICVYSAVFSTIILILSSFISNYFIIAYLAKAISILTSTTITLFLLFLPKLKAVFRQIDCEDPIMQSMGLKIESNTRRFILEDPREQISRLEIQNKVYRCELASLDKEISRLEELLSDYSSGSTKSKINIIETPVDSHFFNLPTSTVDRASWPSTHFQLSNCKKSFTSDNQLNTDHSCETATFFVKLKRFFGSFNTLHMVHQQCQEQDLFNVGKLDKSKPRSSPEMSKQFESFKNLSKAKSEVCIKPN